MHHVEILVEHGLITPSSGKGYGEVYFLTSLMEENFELLTELAKKLKNLTASPKFFQTVIEMTSDAIIIIDMDYDVLFWNAGAERIYGYKGSDIIGTKLPILKGSGLLDSIRETMNRKGNIVSREIKASTKDGTTIYAAMTADGIMDANGVAMACIILSRDITMQKTASEKIERLASFLSLNPNPVFEVDKNGIVDYANEGVSITLKRIGVEGDARVFLPPDIDVILGRLKKSRQENLAREVHVGETTFYLSIHVMPKLRAVRFYAIDITNLKQMEAELLAKEINFRVAADFAYDWEYWVNDQDRFVYISPSCERITGYSREEFLRNHDLLLDIVHQDDRDRVAAHFRDETNNREMYELEFRIRDNKGHIRWIAHACRPVVVEGRWLGCRASNREITQRRKAETALRESEERFRVMTEMMPSMVYVSRISDDTILFTNPSFDRTFGYNKGELVGQKMPIMFYNPAERVAIAEEMERHGIILDKEAQVKRSDGTHFWVHMSLRKIFYGGEPALLGTSFDITRRKSLDDELRTYKEKYERLSQRPKQELKKTKR